MVLKLYVAHLSQPARALMLFVRANKIPVDEEVTVSISNNEHETEEFAQVNRFQKLPAIVHDDFHLSESIAIFRYLCREFPVADHWYPKSSREVARVDEFLAWHHIALRNPICMPIFANFLPNKLGSIVVTDELKEAWMKDMATAIDLFSDLWLRGPSPKFVCGDQITIADLMAVAELEITRLVNFDVRHGRPKIAAYLDRVKAELGPCYDEVHAELYKTAEAIKKSQNK